MVDGGDGNGERLAEGRSGCDVTMAEGRDSGCGVTMAEGRESGCDEGDSFCTLEGQYEPPVAMGNISSQDGSFSTYQGQSQPSSDMGNHSIQGVYTPQGQSRPPFGISRSNYVEGAYTPQGQSRPPFPMGRSNYVEGAYTPQGQSRPPFPMGRSNYVEGVYTPQGQNALSILVMVVQSIFLNLNPNLDLNPNLNLHSPWVVQVFIMSCILHMMGNNTPQSMPPDSMHLLPCGRITKLDQSGLSSIDATSLMTCQRQLADDRVPLKAMRWFYDESKDDGSPLIRKLPRIPFYQGAKLLQNLGTVNAFILLQHFQIGIGFSVPRIKGCLRSDCHDLGVTTLFVNLIKSGTHVFSEPHVTSSSKMCQPLHVLLFFIWGFGCFKVELLLSFYVEMGFSSVIPVGHNDGGLLALKAAQSPCFTKFCQCGA
ncbi:hypothetical protein LOK49_LG09G01595 [Camellia lanceoleosa]|uniref:Uncharacterized protein n=1 Tax=Camellia lanceoleosa TaxID=1840588 RepID=A0ACC0GHR8_9ERIC|nr:hypothetical protein LOK49_LG09G01595 [Camellia lanceoleosa]